MPRPKRMVTVRPRKDRGGWEVDYIDLRGARRRPFYPTEAEAVAEAAKVSKELESGEAPVADSDVRLREYVPKWKARTEAEVEARTLARNEYSLSRYVLPVLGHFKVKQIAARHVLDLVQAMRRKGFAPDTARLARAALSGVLNCAVVDGIIDRNCTLGLKVRLARKGDEQVMHPMAKETLTAFLSAAWDEKSHVEPPYAALFEIMAKAGLRPSEALALQVGDIDWKARTLRVERAFDKDGRTVKATKTHERRAVEISPGLLSSLKQYQLWREDWVPRNKQVVEKSETTKTAAAECEWLFPSETGGPLDLSNVGRTLRRLLKGAKLPEHRLYDLRHTFASHALSRNLPLVWVSRMLGHRNPTTTLKWYARWLPDSSTERYADRLEGVGAPNLK